MIRHLVLTLVMKSKQSRRMNLKIYSILHIVLLLMYFRATFHEKFTIHDWNHPRMNMTAKYVSLSRATKINNIQINI